MDDCDLESLSVKPHKLTPAFKRDVLEYNVTVTSDVKEITFDCFTSDTNASKNIFGADGGRTVPLKEGVVNDIKIEVCAEDGTTKNYMVYVKRLSASDATLSGLKVTDGALDPDFDAGVFEYYCTVSCDTQETKVTPAVPDKKSKALVNNGPADAAVTLNYGDTVVDVNVTSPDGSKNQIYKVNITRKPIPRFIKISDPALAIKYEDPVSLSVMHRPITIPDTQHSYSASVIDEYTKTSKVNPLTDVQLPPGWRVEDHKLDAQLSTTNGTVLLAKGVWSDAKKVGELGAVIKESGCKDVQPSADIKYGTDCAVSHKIETKKWEKSLRETLCGESDVDKLTKAAEDCVQKYLSTLPRPGWDQGRLQKGNHPLEHLQNAIAFYAAAIGIKPKNAAYHLQMALLLEERYLAEDLFGLKPKDEDSSTGHAGVDKAATESSKEEEVQAICVLRGVGPGSPLSLQLKALDQEYHHLLDNQQSSKADHVQGLFAWKSKQATQEGAAANKVSDDETALGQAYIKYLDALSLDESKGQHHFQVGRMLVIQGNYDEAVPRLEAALGWLSSLTMAKFYLAFALSLRDGGPGSRIEETINLLQDTMESLLVKNSKEALAKGEKSWKMSTTLTSDLLRSSNVHLLRGIIQLSKLVKQNPNIKDTLKPTDALHTAAVVAAQVLPTLHRGDTYQQVEWVLLEAHSELLDDLLTTSKERELIAKRCRRLSALIKYATIPASSQLIKLHQRTIERLVTIEPCSSQALVLLGDIQLAQFDGDPSSEAGKFYLDDAKKSYLASIKLEGKPMSGPPLEDVTGQKWWQDKVKAEEEKAKAAAAAAAAPAKPTAGGAAVRGRGAPAARGTARGGAAAGRGAAKAAPAPAARGARGAGTAGRGVTPPRGGKAPAPAAKAAPAGPKLRNAGAVKAGAAAAPAKPASAKAKPAEVEQPKEEAAPAPDVTPVDPKAPVNQRTYHARLGLARAFSRTAETDLDECKKYYNQVIEMAPEVHDAYRESAELLRQKDPLAAVDIYAKFPVPENPSFDDAFIFGEITHILMKLEKYDDDRLAPNLIKMGQIMGVGYIEKYVRTLEDKFKYEILKKTFAAIHGKDIDDPAMVSFFKMKFWN